MNTVKMTVRNTILVFIFLTISGITFIDPVSAAKTKQLAPDFTLASNTGKNLRLKDFRGHVVMINFWATWCAPCRKELPLLNKLYNDYKSKGFVLLGINIDEKTKLTKKMTKELKIKFPVLYDTKQVTSETYDLKAMPSTFIVDKNGVIRFIHYGYKPGYEKKYIKDIKSLL